MHIPPPQPDRHRTIAKDTIIPQPPAPHVAGVHTISADVTGGDNRTQTPSYPQPLGAGAHPHIRRRNRRDNRTQTP